MRIVRRGVWCLITVVFLAALAAGLMAWKSGYRAYIIHTGSMAQTLVPGDLVIDAPASIESLKPGDIITFRHSDGPDLVTHRITKITSHGIHTKGDANRTADVWTIPPRMVVGEVEASVPWMGYAVVYLKQPTGGASLVTIGIGLYLLWGLFFPKEESDEFSGDSEPETERELDELLV